MDLGSSAAPQKSGYNFTLGAGAGSAAGPNDCNGTATITAYYATAVPQTVGTTGTRSFAVNAGNTIWQVTGGDGSDASPSARRRPRSSSSTLSTTQGVRRAQVLELPFLTYGLPRTREPVVQRTHANAA